MSCPHSTSPSASPERCYACLSSIGSAPKAKAVTLDGPRILEDGVDSGRLVDPRFELTEQLVVMPKTILRERAPQRCSFCHEVGHNKGTCPELG